MKIVHFFLSKIKNSSHNRIEKLFLLCFLFLFATVSYAQTVEIQKSVSNAAPQAGTAVNYILNYKCASITNACQGVQITDALPSGLSYIGAAGPSGTVITELAGTVTVDFTGGILAAGSTGQIVISVLVPSNTVPGTVFNNTGNMTSTNAGNANSSVPMTSGANVTLTPGVSADKTGSGSSSPGGAGFFDLYHGNTGQDPVTNYTVSDEFPTNQLLGSGDIVVNAFPGTNNNINIFYQSSAGGSWVAWPGNPRANSGTLATIPTSEVSGAVFGLKFEYGDITGGGLFYPGKTGGSNNGVIRFNFKIDAGAATGTNVENCMNVSGGGVSTATDCQTVFIIAPSNDLFSYKGTFPAGPYIFGQEIFTFLGIQFPPQNTSDGSGIVFADLLPDGLSYVAGSWAFQEMAGTDWASAGSPAPTFEHLSNYAGTGRTLLRWKFAPSDFTIKADGSNKQYQMTFKVTSTKTGNIENCYVGSVATPTSFNSITGQTTDNLDLNGNGSTTDEVTQSCTSFSVIGSPTAAGLESEKLVIGECDTQYSKFPSFGQTVPGGKANYKLTLNNPNGVGITGIKIIDILPFVGDNGIIDPQSRGSQWRPFLAEAVNPPAGISVLYNTSSTPNYTVSDMSTGAGWTSTPPDDITTVRALAFDFGSTVINQNDTKTIDIIMRAPLSAPMNGEIAWNSFAYGSVRADNGNRLLSSEPIKVGIKVKPPKPAIVGDRVWIDTNKNGIQDEPTLVGVDGVRVELYNSSNTLITFTVTSEGGYYLFSNLLPDAYYVKFISSTIPPQYTVSPTGQGGSAALDSDGLQTAQVNLVAGDDNRTLDLGVFEGTACNASVPTGTGATICGTGTAILTASGCSSGYTAKWFTDAVGNSAAPGANSGHSYTTPSISATTDYYVLCQNDADPSCKSSTVKVTAVVNPQPNGITLTPTAPTCTGAMGNDDGKITLSAVTNGTHYAISSKDAAVYDGATTVAAATAISGTPDVQTNIANTGGTYIIRIFNGADACFTDQTVTVSAVTCVVTVTCPPKICTSIKITKN